MRNVALALVLALCSAGQGHAQSAQEVAFAKSVLTAIQAPSIKANREYCGYITRRRNGELAATRARKGRKGSCRPRPTNAWVETLASYHSHGAFSRYAVSELPSVSDVRSDTADDVDGWVATPGGRMWFIDTIKGEIRLICGIGCLPADPNFVAGLDGEIAQRYSFEALARKLGE